MARGSWSIYTLNSDGSTWDADGTIYVPNDDLTTEIISTQQKISLANGSNAFVTPSTKKLKQPITFFWADTTSAFRTQIENYMNNGDTIKIVTDTSENFIGRFISMQRVWLSGIDPDSFDVSVVLEQTE